MQMMQIWDDDENQRMVALNDGEEVREVTFSRMGQGLACIDHTFVDPAYRGQKVAETLIDHTVAKLRKEGCKIIPYCSYAQRLFARKKEYADIQADTEMD